MVARHGRFPTPRTRITILIVRESGREREASVYAAQSKPGLSFGPSFEAGSAPSAGGRTRRVRAE